MLFAKKGLAWDAAHHPRLMMERSEVLLIIPWENPWEKKMVIG